MNTREFMEQTLHHEETVHKFPPSYILRMGYPNVLCITRPQAVCEDGFTISIQSSPFHDSNGYDELELLAEGSCHVPDNFLKYLDEDSSDDDECRRYDFVPIQMVDELINMHGGINFQKSIDHSRRGIRHKFLYRMNY